MDLSGKTALVTGASRGIGREIALALGVRGARVGLVARSREGLEETKRLLGTGEAAPTSSRRGPLRASGAWLPPRSGGWTSW
jgi:NAD(P)-dependent dehydrogenase (short-subunit alcohol dehydrogenase family)